MIFNKNLRVGYHQQDTNDYCGAACAQMILHQMGTELFEQKELFDYIQNNNTGNENREGWNSGPTGLTAAMNHYNPSQETRDFVLYDYLTEHTVSRKIVWTIFHYEVAPIALVKHGNHWVAVKGFQTDKAVKDAGDDSYAILGFFINDPKPKTPLPNPPPPHTIGDRCGDSYGNSTGDSSTYGIYGIDNQHISYDTWINDYMTINTFGKSWKDKFIAICDPEPAPKHDGKQFPVEYLNNGEKMIDKKTAAIYAQKALADFEMSNNYSLSEILGHVTPGDPVIVQRLDKKNDFYYVVPMQTSNKNIHSLVCIDGRFGIYRESCFAKNTDNPLGFKTLNRKDILGLLEDWLKLDSKGVVLDIYPEAVMISPIMVWESCQESYSPYLPFYMVFIGNHKVFVRIDGQVFTELTPNKGGA